MKEQFLNLKGLTELVEYIKKYISEQQEVIPYASYTLFPPVGKPGAIYIDTTTNAIYRWDDNNVKYYALAFDPTDKFIMQCGDSKE